MRLIIDLDGVLVDFNTGFAKLLHKINPQVKMDYMDSVFPACWGWPHYYGYSVEDERRAWQEVTTNGVFWGALFPYETAYKDLVLLYELQNKKNEIYFVTSRPGITAKKQTEEWLYGHGFPGATVIICESNRKAQLAAAIQADVMVEDRPETLMDLPLTTKARMICRPYNISYVNYFGGKAFKSVREALDGIV
jgi:hypothetical protein